MFWREIFGSISKGFQLNSDCKTLVFGIFAWWLVKKQCQLAKLCTSPFHKRIWTLNLTEFSRSKQDKPVWNIYFSRHFECFWPEKKTPIGLYRVANNLSSPVSGFFAKNLANMSYFMEVRWWEATWSVTDIHFVVTVCRAFLVCLLTDLNLNWSFHFDVLVFKGKTHFWEFRDVVEMRILSLLLPLSLFTTTLKVVKWGECAIPSRLAYYSRNKPKMSEKRQNERARKKMNARLWERGAATSTKNCVVLVHSTVEIVELTRLHDHFCQVKVNICSGERGPPVKCLHGEFFAHNLFTFRS